MGRLPAVLTLSELARIDVGGTFYRPLRHPLGVSAFGVDAFTGASAGDVVIERAAAERETLYVVLTGRAEFTVDETRIDAAGGTFVFVPAGASRGAVAAAEETTVLVIDGRTGPPAPFEYWYAAEPAYAARDFERAYTIAAEGLREHPDSAHLHYQVGCYAARAGRREEALRLVRRAFELDPSAREWAHGDADLASIAAELGV